MKSFPMLEATNVAIMIIDMQNDYGHYEGFQSKVMGHDIKRVRGLIPHIKNLKETLVSRGGHAVYTISAREPGFTERDKHKVLPRLIRDTQWYGGPILGTWGAEIIDELSPVRDDVIVRKSRYDAFYKTNLEDVLKAKGISTLIFTGVALNGCVESTLRSAFHRDYDILVARNCVSILDHSYRFRVEEATLETIDMHFGLVGDADDLLEFILDSKANKVL